MGKIAGEALRFGADTVTHGKTAFAALNGVSVASETAKFGLPEYRSWGLAGFELLKAVADKVAGWLG